MMMMMMIMIIIDWTRNTLEEVFKDVQKVTECVLSVSKILVRIFKLDKTLLFVFLTSLEALWYVH